MYGGVPCEKDFAGVLLTQLEVLCLGEDREASVFWSIRHRLARDCRTGGFVERGGEVYFVLLTCVGCLCPALSKERDSWDVGIGVKLGVVVETIFSVHVKKVTCLVL